MEDIKDLKINLFPEGFFEKDRPSISLEEALKDVEPVEFLDNDNKND